MEVSDELYRIQDQSTGLEPTWTENDDDDDDDVTEL